MWFFENKKRILEEGEKAEEGAEVSKFQTPYTAEEFWISGNSTVNMYGLCTDLLSAR